MVRRPPHSGVVPPILHQSKRHVEEDCGVQHEGKEVDSPKGEQATAICVEEGSQRALPRATRRAGEAWQVGRAAKAECVAARAGCAGPEQRGRGCCCRDSEGACIVFCCRLICVFVQRSEMLLITVEMLAVAHAKDPEGIQTALDQLQKDFLGTDSV